MSPKGHSTSQGCLRTRRCSFGLNSGRKSSCPRTQQHHQSPGGLQHQLHKSWGRPSFPNQPHCAGDKDLQSPLPQEVPPLHGTELIPQDGAGASTGRALGGSSRVISGLSEQRMELQSPQPPPQPALGGIKGEKRSKAQCHVKSRSPSSSSSSCATRRGRNSSVGWETAGLEGDSV